MRVECDIGDANKPLTFAAVNAGSLNPQLLALGV